MTISTHSYKVTSGSTTLNLVNGSIDLDAGSIPYVTASLVLAVADAELLDILDPRDSPRVTISATGEGHDENTYTPWVSERKNLVAASNFEDGATAKAAAFSNTSLSTTTAESHSGTRSLKVVCSGASGGYTQNIASSNQGLTPTGSVGEFTGSAWVKAPVGVSITTRMQEYNVNAAGGLLSMSDMNTFTGTGDWMRVYATGTNTSATALYRLTVQASSTTFYVDDVMVEKGTLQDFFDGDTPNTELENYTWVTPILQPKYSAKYTRSFIGTHWVPENYRDFDLGIRSVRPDRAAGTVSIELASDEAMLTDFAQLVDDETPYDLSASLRDVVNYVLDKALGTELEASPALDADVTPYWQVTNFLLNPSVQGGTGTPWTAAGNCTVFQASIGRTGNASSGYKSNAAGQIAVAADAYPNARQGVTPGKTYIFSGYGVRYQNPVNRNMTAVIRFYDENGATLWADFESAPASLSDDSVWTRAVVIATAPPGAAKAATFFRVNGSTGANQIGYIDDAMFYEGTRILPFFYGGSSDAGYEYSWTKDPNASHSVRTPYVERDPESLVWRAGVTGMEFLRPLLMSYGYRLVCDENRKWTLRDETYRASGAMSFRYGVNITTADENLSREDDSWFDGAVYVYTWTDKDGIEQTRLDSFALSGSPTKVIQRELNTPYPGPGRAEAIVKRAQGKGREISVSAVPSWKEQTDQPLSIRLDGTPIQTGISSRLRFDLTTDEVTVTSRTTDTNSGAWILLPTGEEWLDSPAGASWTEEVL